MKKFRNHVTQPVMPITLTIKEEKPEKIYVIHYALKLGFPNINVVQIHSDEYEFTENKLHDVVIKRKDFNRDYISRNNWFVTREEAEKKLKKIFETKIKYYQRVLDRYKNTDIKSISTLEDVYPRVETPKNDD